MKCWLILACLLISLSCAGNVADPLSPPNDPTNSNGELVFEEDEKLQETIASLEPESKGKLGVFALLMEDERAVSLNGAERFAMQSVVKLPVAMLVMQQVAEGKFALDQKIKFTADDLVPTNQRSPLRDKNPKGGEITIDELIRLALVESDGSACDILTRIVGGPAALQSYIQSLSIPGIEVKRTHKEFAKDWALQYENWATPEAATELLTMLWSQKRETSAGAEQKELLLLKYMYESIPGQNRLKGELPPGTPVAHKTGTGGTKDGITSATNDVGIITLPNGKHVAIAVCVGDSSADEKTRERVIAKVAKAVWDTWGK